MTFVTALFAEGDYIDLIFDVTTCRAARLSAIQTPCIVADKRRDVFLRLQRVPSRHQGLNSTNIHLPSTIVYMACRKQWLRFAEYPT